MIVPWLLQKKLNSCHRGNFIQVLQLVPIITLLASGKLQLTATATNHMSKPFNPSESTPELCACWQLQLKPTTVPLCSFQSSAAWYTDLAIFASSTFFPKEDIFVIYMYIDIYGYISHHHEEYAETHEPHQRRFALKSPIETGRHSSGSVAM